MPTQTLSQFFKQSLMLFMTEIEVRVFRNFMKEIAEKAAARPLLLEIWQVVALGKGSCGQVVALGM